MQRKGQKRENEQHTHTMGTSKVKQKWKQKKKKIWENENVEIKTVKRANEWKYHLVSAPLSGSDICCLYVCNWIWTKWTTKKRQQNCERIALKDIKNK